MCFWQTTITSKTQLCLNKVCSFLAVASAAPQFVAISEVVNSRTGGTFGISLDCGSKIFCDLLSIPSTEVKQRAKLLWPIIPFHRGDPSRRQQPGHRRLPRGTFRGESLSPGCCWLWRKKPGDSRVFPFFVFVWHFRREELGIEKWIWALRHSFFIWTNMGVHWNIQFAILGKEIVRTTSQHREE